MCISRNWRAVSFRNCFAAVVSSPPAVRAACDEHIRLQSLRRPCTTRVSMYEWRQNECEWPTKKVVTKVVSVSR